MKRNDESPRRRSWPRRASTIALVGLLAAALALPAVAQAKLKLRLKSGKPATEKAAHPQDMPPLELLSGTLSHAGGDTWRLDGRLLRLSPGFGLLGAASRGLEAPASGMRVLLTGMTIDGRFETRVGIRLDTPFAAAAAQDGDRVIQWSSVDSRVGELASRP